MGRNRARARVAVRDRAEGWRFWAGLAVLAGGLAAALPALGQPVPEVVAPRSGSAALPPGPSDGPAPRPRSENPLADGGGARPLPDSGVVAPPASSLGSGTVITPPAAGSMPVIPPPGSPGGDGRVVPK